jgi:hypothetical protein
MPFEELATSIQADLLEIKTNVRGINEKMMQMATKQDIADLREEFIVRFATHSELQSVKEELLEEIKKIKYAKEIDELRARMTRVEREHGIRCHNSAA